MNNETAKDIIQKIQSCYGNITWKYRAQESGKFWDVEIDCPCGNHIIKHCVIANSDKIACEKCHQVFQVHMGVFLSIQSNGIQPKKMGKKETTIEFYKMVWH